jgi:hypothetical protein
MPVIDIRAHGGVFGGSKIQNPLPYHKFYKDKAIPFNFFGTTMTDSYNTSLYTHVNKRFSDRFIIMSKNGNNNTIYVQDVINCAVKQFFSISPFNWNPFNFAYLADNGDFICVCTNGATFLGRAKYNPSTGLYEQFNTVQIYPSVSGNAQVVTGFVETSNYYTLTIDLPGTQTIFINKTTFTVNRIVNHPGGIILRLLAYDEQNDIVYGYHHGNPNANLIFVKFNGTTGSQLLRLDIPVANGTSNGYYATSAEGVFLHPSKQYICKVMGKTNNRTSGGLCIVYFDATTGAFVQKVNIQDDGVFLDPTYYAIYPYTVYSDGHVLMAVTNANYTSDINKLMIVDINTGIVKAYSRLSPNMLLSWQSGWNFGEKIYSIGTYSTQAFGNCIELYRF